MQHHIIGQSGNLVRVPGGVSTLRTASVPLTLDLDGFQDHVAFSFYFHSYRWAHFWRGIMRATPCDGADLHYVASSAFAIGYLAKVKGDANLAIRAAQLSSRAVTAVQIALSQGTKHEVASMLGTVAAMGVYNVHTHKLRFGTSQIN
jgi:hypothetical protein